MNAFNRYEDNLRIERIESRFKRIVNELIELGNDISEQINRNSEIHSEFKEIEKEYQWLKKNHKEFKAIKTKYNLMSLEIDIFTSIMKYLREFIKISNMANDIRKYEWKNKNKHWYRNSYLGSRAQTEAQDMYFKFFKRIFRIISGRESHNTSICFLCLKEIERIEFVGHHSVYIWDSLGFIVLQKRTSTYTRLIVYSLCKNCHNKHHNSTEKEKKKINLKMKENIIDLFYGILYGSQVSDFS